ncbi:MAG: hypothetical protein A4E30_01135 [Methanomassiliicoccales archaeon PtaB.Bin215]|nr:MAG: hypothetical protein A4E30_01135 [Methanomassiliicoccales archaeon PtaB.Bin215]
MSRADMLAVPKPNASPLTVKSATGAPFSTLSSKETTPGAFRSAPCATASTALSLTMTLGRGSSKASIGLIMVLSHFSSPFLHATTASLRSCIVTESSSVIAPERVRRSAFMLAPTPNASPMSTHNVRMYVPASQSTLNKTSLPDISRISMECTLRMRMATLTAERTGGV